MSKTTSVNAIPYPEDGEAPDGPAQIKALAELLDTLKWGSRNLKPTIGRKLSTEALVLTESDADIPGTELEITPAVESYLAIVAVFRRNASKGSVNGSVYDGAFTQGVVAQVPETTNSETRQVTGFALVTLTPELHKIKLRASRSGATASSVSDASYLYLLLAK